MGSALSLKRHLALAILATMLAGCSGSQSALNSAGIQAHRVETLWWIFLGVTSLVYLAAMAAMFRTLLHKHREPVAEGALVDVTPAGEKRTHRTINALVGLTVLILFALLLTEFFTGRKLHSLNDPSALRMRATAQQWWWNFEYEDAVTSNTVTAPNEMHLPVGRAVEIDLVAHDVIHSFWVPNLSGKQDMIPGHPSRMWLRADREGTFTGQCAEFCGAQHAHMRFTVVCEPPAKFQKWLDAQRSSPPAPVTAEQKAGQKVFLSNTCVMCHRIQDTDAGASIGPDLTHVASRPTLAAGTLPNNRGNLAGWVVNAQHIKPGTLMPPNPLSPEDVQNLLAYLETLK